MGWNEELNALVASFERQAVEVGQWDQRIIYNGEQIIAMNDRVNKLEALQKEIDTSLTYVVSQQSELDGLLTGIERELPALQNATIGSRLGALDAERDRMYESAEEAQEKVIDISNQLSKMIHEINSAATADTASAPTSAAGQGGSATGDSGTSQSMVEIAQILNSHLDALVWIDHKVDELKKTSLSVKSQAVKASSEMERFTNASSNDL